MQDSAIETEGQATYRAARPASIGRWIPDGAPPETGPQAVARAVRDLGRTLVVVETESEPAVATGGQFDLDATSPADKASYPLRAYVPALHPSTLGDPTFRHDHRLRYAYVAGAMANGISSERLVEAMARAGMLAFFGAAGLSIEQVERAIDRIQSNLGDRPYGFNLIHSPNEPALESAIVDLYLRRGVHLVSASAYLDLTLPLVRYRVSGIRRDDRGRVVCPNRVIAKVSRVEVARKFLSPPPEKLLQALVANGDISTEQARWAGSIPVAEDITAEADSGGHTDNRPALALIPTMLALRDAMQREHGYDRPLRVGAAGGMATPASAAAAFGMGAAYVLTGSVNQACVEAGTSDAARKMLARASQADVAMAPAADMFEMGVKVQVLKWGTMFALRARKLYDLYRTCAGLDAIPAPQRALLERDYFRCTLAEAWSQTRDYFVTRDPDQVTRAERDPKHRMALVFRSYLGRSSDWANRGEPSREADYQIWCGPAMGAFNEWVRGTFLEHPERRDVVTVALNLLHGAAVLTRVQWLRAQGVDLPPTAQAVAPMERAALAALLDAPEDPARE
ncbi:MAG: PfaD family polyunsaturated fatty acid/polyketide biosynthesis protein [Phycisphaerae bacterium]